MKDYKELYEKLNSEFQSYQIFAENRLQNLNWANRELERKLSIFVNIVEVNKYINSYISDANLLAMINDMIVGILGVTYSTIHLMQHDCLVAKTTNLGDLENTKIHYSLEELSTRKSFIKNDKEGIFKNSTDRKNINSLMAVPIYIKETIIGYIIVEHIYYSFFRDEDINFVSAISNQVAIAIENSILYKKIQNSAERDSFLNIYNRKHFYHLVDNEVLNNTDNLYSLVMCDIDNFKLVNDTYGHQVGDLVLKNVVKIIESNLDNQDILARYGGEEIIILIRSSYTKSLAIKKVEKMRKEIETSYINLEGNQKVNVTTSFGMSFSDDLDIKDKSGKIVIDKIIKKADDNLYIVKRTGKNKVKF
ncbi:sensor domain-containing diguanylate cyclase [Clostridium mediterraneense]|uniref:sensor domain-containing diguanylate cyclase n=1 Tax=Clostridium mediterraneense TaxID=1805472 RepID=UPI000834F0CD|nr:sensor domain-containing diguanylate cyclase [Clostridium mediterraneense]